MTALASLRDITHPIARDRLRWAVRVRWLVIGGFLLLAIIAHASGLFTSIRPCLAAALIGVALNAANHWCVAHWRGVLPMTAVALGGDLLLITYVTSNTGGVHSPFITMYVVQVLATAMLVDTAVAGISAVVAVALFGAALTLDARGLTHGAGLGTAAPGGAPIESSLIYQVAWTGFFLYGLTLLVYLGGYISQRLRRSERDVAEKNRELETAVATLAATNCQLVGAYERLQHTEAQLIQSEKMQALGQLVAGVAHELNNPISFISANIEHLRLYLDRLSEILHAYASATLTATDRARLEQLRQTLHLDDVLTDLPSLLRDCEEGAQRTKRIVTELRTFSRSDEDDRWRRVDIHHCLESTLTLLGYRLKNTVTVQRDFGDLPEIDCIPGQINQVLMNLLANAADAVGAAGRIWISTRASPAAAAGRGHVVITVRDDGVGMSPEVQRRIFDPFFTTKDVGKGTGLGLSVSYGIVKRHGGSLEVTSAPAQGSTFALRLPVEQPPPA